MKRKLFPIAIPFIVLSLLTFPACEEEESIIYPEVDPFDKLVAAQNVTVKLMNGTPDLSVRGRGDLSGVQLQVTDQVLTVALPNPGTAQNVVVEIFHNDMVSVSSTQNSRVSLASDFGTSSPTLILSAFNNSAIYSYHTLSVDTLDIRLSDEAFVGLSQVDVSKNILYMFGQTLCFLEGMPANSSSMYRMLVLITWRTGSRDGHFPALWSLRASG